MRIYLNPAYSHLRSFVERLPEAFDADEGVLLYCARNVVRLFEVGDLRLAVKRYRRPNLCQAFAYTWLRRSKAQRGYELAERLQKQGFATPPPLHGANTTGADC